MNKPQYPLLYFTALDGIWNKLFEFLCIFGISNKVYCGFALILCMTDFENIMDFESFLNLVHCCFEFEEHLK